MTYQQTVRENLLRIAEELEAKADALALASSDLAPSMREDDLRERAAQCRRGAEKAQRS